MNIQTYFHTLAEAKKYTEPRQFRDSIQFAKKGGRQRILRAKTRCSMARARFRQRKTQLLALPFLKAHNIKCIYEIVGSVSILSKGTADVKARNGLKFIT